MRVRFKLLHEDAKLPAYATAGASGFDLVAIEDVEIEPGETLLVKTGLSVEIPEGYEMQVRPRSGLSLKTPLRVANSPGTVDSDYRGEVCVIMNNSADPRYVPVGDLAFRNKAQTIKKGDRIAQGVICPVIRADLVIVTEHTDTVRGAGGFGSTGK
jgi:dUTP pyrophosphatase